MNITVRPASESDYQVLCIMEQGQDGCGHQAAVFVRQVMTLWPRTVLVARCDEKIAGFLVGAVSSDDPGTGWVLRVRVEEEMRRKGVATAMIDQVTGLMHALGLTRILLSCSPENQGALALYEKCGFLILHHEAGYFGPGEDRYILGRSV